MSDILNRAIVLVLNRHWQAIDVKTPIETFSMLVNGSATALDIKMGEEMRPVTWDEWLTLQVRETDFSIGTVRGGIRVPTVVVLARFDKVPRRRPKFCARAIWERDGGVCQYTGRKLRPSEGNIDHIVPRSRGGEHRWDNVAAACRDCNLRKRDRTPREAGMPLARPARAPRHNTWVVVAAGVVPEAWKPYLALAS